MRGCAERSAGPHPRMNPDSRHPVQRLHQRKPPATLSLRPFLLPHVSVRLASSSFSRFISLLFFFFFSWPASFTPTLGFVWEVAESPQLACFLNATLVTTQRRMKGAGMVQLLYFRHRPSSQSATLSFHQNSYLDAVDRDQASDSVNFRIKA